MVLPANSARAYSYIRFSTLEQRHGDSYRRQAEASRAWCERNGIVLDESLTLHDLGKSAFRGAHKDDKAALGCFLRAVKQGKVSRGSYLIVENLDRLSREQERDALRLWMDLLDAGVNIVQLNPETVFRHEKTDMVDIIRAIIELSRGHSESAAKSFRATANWQAKRDALRNGRPADMGLLPAWITSVDDTLQLIPERAATVLRIFRLAADGHGPGLIVKELVRGGVEAFGPSGQWSRAYVALLLKDRRAAGWYSPRNRAGKKDGEPIPCLPAAVTEAEWKAAKTGMEGRRRQTVRGRVGEHINIFAGLLKDARTQSAYYVSTRTCKGRHWRALVSKDAVENGSKVYGFNDQFFEDAILEQLRKIDTRQILGDEPGAEEAIVLGREREAVLAELADIEDQLMDGSVKALAPILAKKQARLDGR